MCEHNTDEIHCEICQTGYNSVPWMAGTETDANECEGNSMKLEIIFKHTNHLLHILFL